MNTRFSVSNFRAFDEKGASIDIRPITILTGCNSSGKSSLAKSIMLLNDIINSISTMSEGETPRLDFGKKALSLLGNFETVLNRDAVSRGVKTMTISYDVASPYIGIPLTVTYEFGLSDNDLKKNGFIKKVVIADHDGCILMKGLSPRVIENILHADHKKYYDPFGLVEYGVSGTNLNLYKRHFFAFALTFLAMNVAHNTYGDYVIMNDTSKEDVQKVLAQVNEFLSEIKTILGVETISSSLDFYSYHTHEVFKMIQSDIKLLENAARKNIITYMPILDQLDAISKEDFAASFTAICDKAGIKLKRRISILIDEFIHSEYPIFSDYYRCLEDSFLKTSFSSKDISDVEDQVDWPSTNTIPGLERKKKDDAIHEMDIITFERAFRLLCDIDSSASGIYKEASKETPETYYNHSVLKDFARYRTALVKDVLSKDVCEHLAYVGSSRINVQRLYPLDASDSFGQTISDYFEAIRVNSWNREYQPGTFINKWLRIFGIGERFEVEPLAGGIGVVLKIYENKEDIDGKLLADYGYGISQLISILIEIETAILNKGCSSRPKGIRDYSKGIASIFSVLNAEYVDVRHPRTIIIEEPEIHQHPSYQSKLAEMFVDAMKTYNVQFILETHSEYLIRRLQNLVAKKDLSNDDVSILYVNDNTQSQEGKIKHIRVEDDGRLSEPFGSGFFDEADNLAMNLLMIKGGRA